MNIENDKKYKNIFETIKRMKKYKMVKIDLPESEWFTCFTCDGTKHYYMNGDLHKSGGVVPCYNCNKDGLMTYKFVEVLREDNEH